MSTQETYKKEDLEISSTNNQFKDTRVLFPIKQPLIFTDYLT